VLLGSLSFTLSAIIGWLALTAFNQNVAIATAGVLLLMVPIYLASEYLMRNV